MSVPFQISALAAEQFRPLFEMSDEALAQRGGRRCIADAKPGFPCRVSLEDAEAGEALILVPFIHHDVASPYRASGPVFVRAGVQQACLRMNEVPASVRLRLLSVRAYDQGGSLVDAEVVEGHQIESLIEKFFTDDQVAYLHLHNARPGCYNCRVDRAVPGVQEVHVQEVQETAPAFASD